MTASEWVRERHEDNVWREMSGGKPHDKSFFLDSKSHDWENAHNKFPLGSSASGKSPLISLNLARLHNYLKLKVTQTNTRFHYPFKFFIILLLIRKRPPSASTKFDEYNFLFQFSTNILFLLNSSLIGGVGWLVEKSRKHGWLPGEQCGVFKVEGREKKGRRICNFKLDQLWQWIERVDGI